MVAVLKLHNAIAKVEMGDKLVAFGFDKSSNSRMWSGVTFSVSSKQVNGTEIVKTINTSGEQMVGMSGCPVFNGCGLVGVATSVYFDPAELNDGTIVNMFSGSVVHHVDHLVSALEAGYDTHSLPPHILMRTVDIPRKHYCEGI
jgi:hypothetical protein